MIFPVYFDDFLDDTQHCSKKFFAHQIDETIKWNDIQSSLKYAPEKKDLALLWIQRCLGYLPKSCIYMPHVAFIQILLQNMENGLLSKEQFADEIIIHAKQIRNDDMKKDGWVANRNYKHDLRKTYQCFLPAYKQQARSRLSTMLGFEPELKYSLAAELELRQLFEMDYFHPDLSYCSIDFKAATIVCYRKDYYSHGEAFADQSELIGIQHNCVATPF